MMCLIVKSQVTFKEIITISDTYKMEVDAGDNVDETSNYHLGQVTKVYEGTWKPRKKFHTKPQNEQDPNKKVRKFVYNPDWEEIPDFQKWLAKAQQTSEDGTVEDKALCLACDKLIRPHLGDLKLHGEGLTHIKNCHETG